MAGGRARAWISSDPAASARGCFAPRAHGGDRSGARRSSRRPGWGDRGSRSTPSTGRWAISSATEPTPNGSTSWPPTSRTRCARWSARRTMEAQPRRAQAGAGRAARAAAGRRARGAGRGGGLCVGRSGRVDRPRQAGARRDEAARRSAASLVETGPYLPAGKVVEKLKLGGNAKALGQACGDYEDARAAFLNRCLRRDLPARCTRSSRAAAPVCRPLRGRQRAGWGSTSRTSSSAPATSCATTPACATATPSASHVMVDEFQDTNPLQNELLELLERAGKERAAGTPSRRAPDHSCSGSATRTSRSTASATPTSTSFATTTATPTRRAAPRPCRSTSAAAARSWTPSTSPSSGPSARSSSLSSTSGQPCAAAGRRPAGRAAGGGSLGGALEGHFDGEETPFGETLRSARYGGRARRGFSPAG